MLALMPKFASTGSGATYFRKWSINASVSAAYTFGRPQYRGPSHFGAPAPPPADRFPGNGAEPRLAGFDQPSRQPAPPPPAPGPPARGHRRFPRPQADRSAGEHRQPHVEPEEQDESDQTTPKGRKEEGGKSANSKRLRTMSRSKPKRRPPSTPKGREPLPQHGPRGGIQAPAPTGCADRRSGGRDRPDGC
jgi:hypothetical protein